MIVTLSLLYLFYYLIALFFLFFSFFSFFSLSSISFLNFSNYIYIYKKYSAHSVFLFFCFFLLTGLPPASLFLLKFSILSILLLKLNIWLSLMIFFIFLVSMFFYSQVFKFKNYFSSNINTLIKLKQRKYLSINSNLTFKLYFLVNLIFIVFIFNIFFFLDFFLIIIVHN